MVEKTLDLHMHSTVSDGTDTPPEILARARALGLGLFSITDHDAIKGCQIVQERLTEGDPAFLTGVEFSCRDEEGQYHILGYGFDPEAEPICRTAAISHSYRMQKITARLAFLKENYGFSLTNEEQAQLLSLDNPGKPHIANLMVKHGYASSKEEAFRLYIDKIRFVNEFLRPEAAIQSIREAGGIPVLAHPSFGSGEQRIVGEEMDRRLKRLTAYGLEGVEAFYSGFTEELRTEMLRFAEQYGLYVTAGSDYHGTNKTVAMGDTGLPREAEWPDGLRRFLADVKPMEK
ncbi:MAG: PHP domain-containing protein [Oscillospiraceae bacterium]|nr:PHP domain-containing protein [Oscillospiraceae bacterium]